MKPAHTYNERRRFDMNIGDKIPVDGKIKTIDTKIVEIAQIIPAKYRDDGEEQCHNPIERAPLYKEPGRLKPLDVKIISIKSLGEHK